MSEPIRRRIVEILASGEHTAGELSDCIVAEFQVTPSAVSRHLRILRENQAVIVRAEWVNRLYRLDPQFLTRLRKEVRHFQNLWKRRIGVMARNDENLMLSTNGRREGARKGHRAKSRRHDEWRP